jgi:hypothetical protein
MTDEFLDVVEAAEPPSNEDLASVAALARKQLRLQGEVAEATAALKAKQAELDLVSERELPDAMLQLGLEEFKLAGGGLVTIDDDWQASIPLGTKTKDPEERARLLGQRARALAWLVANGHGALIKRKLEVQFGRGETSLADKLIAFLKKQWPDRKVGDKEEVHAQTLSAFVREQIAQGKMSELPLDDLGARHVRRAVVVLPHE